MSPNLRTLAIGLFSLVRPKMTTQVVNNSVFRTFFKKEKLSGANFIDWYRSLCIVLSAKDKLTYLEHPLLAMYVLAAGQVLPPDVFTTHQTLVKASKKISCLMLMTMTRELQKIWNNLVYMSCFMN
ncbi:hypothetical protein Tco_1467015 [Tanacetum coccineum]